MLGVLPALIIGTNSSVTNVNPYGAVNTVTSPPICSTFPLVDYSTSAVSSYTYTAPSVPAGATYLQAGAPTFSCAQAYVGWQTDAAYSTGGSTSALPSSVIIVPSPRSAPLSPAEAAFPVFSTNRYGQFTYTIPVSAAGSYNVRLLFVENYWATIGSRVFSVTAQGVTIISHLDLNAIGPNPTVPCTEGTRGDLTQTCSYIFNTTVQVTAASLAVQLAFIPSSDNAIVSAVEVSRVSGSPAPASTAAPTQPKPASSTAAPKTTKPISSTAAVATRSTGIAQPSPTGGSGSSSSFSLYINCGSTTGFTDGVGRVWVADKYYDPASETWTGTPDNGAEWTNTTADLYTLYQSNRFNDQSYVIPVPSAGTYHVTLHYAEMYWTTVGRRVFNVSVQGVTVVGSLDLIATTGYRYSAYTTTHTVTVTSSGLTVLVGFVNLVDNALVSGMEIVKAS